METPEPGQADGEEQMMDLRPSTRSNPEGAEDWRSSNGSLNNSLASPWPVKPKCNIAFSSCYSLPLPKMLQSPYFFFDVVYFHNGTEEQTEDTNWSDVYTSFRGWASPKGMCYRFEVSLCGAAIELHNCMAKLLCHPLQRPFQSHASYSLLEDDLRPQCNTTDDFTQGTA
ncbi:BRISC and BRCA1-A complex member 1-like [Myxocyprinus asiaticus]|uniref:BRISC and BRCA1-A complex member 1-like n=1 Tax=Myxocyprinus asiaticus TaxID=70543 RepID=UPI002222E8B1|nr:BRISC and BRCA1-A complex member 1-like [Myxocyprinus asiaticus]